DARAADFLSRRKHAKFSVADAGLVRLEVKLAAQAVEFKSVDLSLREVEQAGDRGISARSAAMELSGERPFDRVAFSDQRQHAFDRNLFDVGLGFPFVFGTEAPLVQDQ